MKLEMTRKQMRAKAREILKGNWSLMTLVYTVLTVLPSLFHGFMVLTSQQANESIAIAIIIVSFILTSIVSLFVSVFVVAYSIDLASYPDSSIQLSARLKRIMESDVTGKMFYVQLLVSLRIMLWTLLLLVPGIIKSYSYSQAIYIAHDAIIKGEKKSASQCILESRQMMDGAKSNLFVLSLSFIGWGFVAGLVVGLLGITDITVLNSSFTHYAMALFVANAIMGVVVVYIFVTQYVFYLELKKTSSNENDIYDNDGDEIEIISHND